MSFSRRRFIAISAAAIAMPVNAGAENNLVRWQGNALGASASLTISGLSQGEAGQLIEAVEFEIRRFEKIFSLYLSDSYLNRLNESGRIDAAPFEFAQLLSHAGSIHNATGGAFDPTIQPLWQTYANNRGAPGAKLIKRIKNNIGWQHLQFSESSVRFLQPGMAITLNGIAQGFITDKVAHLLKANGLNNVLVSIGEISALGQRSAGKDWKIGISEKQDGVAEEFLELNNAAIATSAPLGTLLDIEGNTGHIIDPRSGTVPRIWRRISVIHKSATIADGLSTAFAVMNRIEIGNAIRQFKGTKLIAVDTENRRYVYG